MGHAAVNVPMTAASFLAWDSSQTVKHEFVGGEVFAMAGADDRHVTASLNLLVALHQHLQGKPCRPYSSDMKLYVEAASSYFYPDVMVTCSEADRARSTAKQDAMLVVEILSPSTAAYDRGEKFAAYRQLPALKEYVLIDLDTRRCDIFRRNPADLWVLHPVDAGQPLHFESVQLSVSSDRLFANVGPTPNSVQPA